MKKPVNSSPPKIDFQDGVKKPVNLKAPKFSGQTMWKNLWISGTLVNSWWDVVKNPVNLKAPKISIWNLWKNLRISHTGLYNIIILWWGIGWCKLKKLRIARRFIRNFSLWSAFQNLWIANATISSLGDMWKACYLDRKWPMKKKTIKTGEFQSCHLSLVKPSSKSKSLQKDTWISSRHVYIVKALCQIYTSREFVELRYRRFVDREKHILTGISGAI